jgi:hypothetical protein
MVVEMVLSMMMSLQVVVVVVVDDDEGSDFVGNNLLAFTGETQNDG